MSNEVTKKEPSLFDHVPIQRYSLTFNDGCLKNEDCCSLEKSENGSYVLIADVEAIIKKLARPQNMTKIMKMFSGFGGDITLADLLKD